MSEAVVITEVGPRDGLQNEALCLTPEQKFAWLKALAGAGLRRLEIGSFVRPDAVPQLADSDELCRRWLADEACKDIQSIALVANDKGLERALASGVPEVALLCAVSEKFNQRNIRQSVQQSLEGATSRARTARENGRRVRIYISTAFGCPYEGPTAPARVMQVFEQVVAMECDEMVFGDTLGVATPRAVRELLQGIDPACRPKVGLHFHDTYGTALANVMVGLELGYRRFDASAAGLGGCPYAAGASGNLASEDLVYVLEQEGFDTGVDLAALARASSEVLKTLKRPGSSRVRAALLSSGLEPIR